MLADACNGDRRDELRRASSQVVIVPPGSATCYMAIGIGTKCYNDYRHRESTLARMLLASAAAPDCCTRIASSSEAYCLLLSTSRGRNRDSSHLRSCGSRVKTIHPTQLSQDEQ